MPRIRKKTSNRGSTNDRKKIQQKVRESRKKAKKAAKKNPQWKSKTPKDPGIPNNFPFKDQILAEVAEQRRIDAAEKLRKKEERKAMRAKAKTPDGDDEMEGNEQEIIETAVELEELKGLQIGNDAVGGIGAKQLLNAKTFSPPVSAPEPEASDDDEVPMLINRELPNLQAVLDESDVIIEVLDARDPLSFRSSHLEQLIATKPGQRILLVLNKIDTCPRESVTAWAAYLRTHHPTVLFRSAFAFLPSGPEQIVKAKGKGKAKARFDDGLGVDSILACLGHWAKAKKGNKPLAVAVVGVTNVGKSSLINSLIRSSSLPIYSTESSSRGPTTTELPQEVVVEAAGKQIRLIDTPGLSWEVTETAENLEILRARDILLRSKGRIDRLKDPTSVVTDIVTRSNAEDLMLLYNLPAFPKGDSTSFLSGVARSNYLVKKRGDLDLVGASRILLRDWNTGKFARYTSPPTTSTTRTSQPKDAGLKKLYESDAAILETITPRKELRKAVGLVRLISGEVNTREAILEEPWLKEEENDEEADDGQMEVDGPGEDVDEEDEEGEKENNGSSDEEEEEEEAPSPQPQKQKRKRTNDPTIAPPSKKVAFGPDPKDSKQARRAASTGGKTQDISPTKSKATTYEVAHSISKKPVTVKPKQKVGNVAAKTKATVKGGGAKDSEAYDFGKFF
ncbi:hypothetical protein H0H87_004224 [Tephrocybe sp. NHM501043]|nr:hypothetical protein H0H87_004224 [Tephrocybe sp. NHM501043]